MNNERGNWLRAGGERGVRPHINSIHSAHTKPVLKQGEMNNERGNLLGAVGERGVRAHFNGIHSAHTKPVLKQEELTMSAAICCARVGRGACVRTLTATTALTLNRF